MGMDLQSRRMFGYLGGLIFSIFGLTGFYAHWTLGVNSFILFCLFLFLLITDKEGEKEK